MFAPYSTQLVKGEKTIETRNYQLPNKCKGVRIGIVEIMPKGLPSKKPELVGEVVFVDCKGKKDSCFFLPKNVKKSCRGKRKNLLFLRIYISW